MTQLLKEEVRLDNGKLVILCVKKEGRTVKYRVVFNADSWDKDEWVRLDYSEEEGAYIQIRRKMKGLDCERDTMIRLISKIMEGLESAVGE
ncbi:MAG: hypothetical protein DRN78_02870 [Thermoproteota archaeon]|nr:MAG: hypothetical protein DRN78_02870 [Candidatus Korarchaeota archaeon]